MLFIRLMSKHSKILKVESLAPLNLDFIFFITTPQTTNIFSIFRRRSREEEIVEVISEAGSEAGQVGGQDGVSR